MALRRVKVRVVRVEKCIFESSSDELGIVEMLECDGELREMGVGGYI